MPRASSALCVPALLAVAALAHAIELPVIVNGAQVAQAPKAPADQPPAASKGPLPVIINNPSAVAQPAAGEAKKADAKAPVIVNESPAPKPATAPPARAAVAYYAPFMNEYMAPVAYNAYGIGGPMLGGYGMGYMSAPYSTGYYGAYGYGAGYAYSGYAQAVALGASLVDLRPPRVEVLDTGVRPTVGRLASMPAVASPVMGHAIVVYYR